jgi:hypothetical protein
MLTSKISAELTCEGIEEKERGMLVVMEEGDFYNGLKTTGSPINHPRISESTTNTSRQAPLHKTSISRLDALCDLFVVIIIINPLAQIRISSVRSPSFSLFHIIALKWGTLSNIGTRRLWKSLLCGILKLNGKCVTSSCSQEKH